MLLSAADVHSSGAKHKNLEKDFLENLGGDYVGEDERAPKRQRTTQSTLFEGGRAMTSCHRPTRALTMSLLAARGKFTYYTTNNYIHSFCL